MKGHVSYFDRRKICPPGGSVVRSVVRRDGKELDELLLKCKSCGEEVVVEVDCEGYK